MCLTFNSGSCWRNLYFNFGWTSSDVKSSGISSVFKSLYLWWILKRNNINSQEWMKDEKELIPHIGFLKEVIFRTLRECFRNPRAVHVMKIRFSHFLVFLGHAKLPGVMWRLRWQMKLDTHFMRLWPKSLRRFLLSHWALTELVVFT